jgi:4-hydroxy-tetrahydrodipicolinate reductase
MPYNMVKFSQRNLYMVKKTNLVIAGCTGRMGRMILDILPKSQNFNLVGLLEKSGHPDIGKDYSKVNQASTFDLDISDNYKETLSKADVLIDFTLPEATLHSLELTKGMDVNHVIGTTGFSSAEEEKISMYARSKTIVKAGNMSLGVNLITKLTEMVASTLDEEFDIEILEMHHKEKIDAPSGTALMLGEAAAKGRDVSLEDVKDLDRTNVRAKRIHGNIGLTALRGGDVVGEHSVIFAGFGERIVISHIANNREIFARGALKAAQWTLNKEPKLYSMLDVLGI